MSSALRRVAGVMIAAALTVSFVPVVGMTGIVGAADPLPPVADPMAAGGVCADAPGDEPFTDVGSADIAQDEIACLFHSGITEGTTATTYSPNGTLTRRQMALFLARTADTADELEVANRIAALPAHDGSVEYPDTAAESLEVRIAIGRLSEAGVALGYADGTYGPRDELSRRQMAKFIARLLEFLTGEDLVAPTGDYFDDDEGDSGELELNQLAELGVFQGDGLGNVNPGEDLTRRQMALILLRALQVLHDAGDISPLFPPEGPLAPATASATATGTTVTLTYAESATTTADSYRIYRIVRTGTTCPNFNTAGSTGRGAYPTTATATQPDATPTSDGNTNRTFTDSGLTASTTYCYAVTTVDDGVESATAAQTSVTTGVNGPTITDVRAVDGGTSGLVDAGDVHQFIFSEPMAGTTDDPGQLYRLADGDGTVAEVVCGTNASCVLQPAGTFNGTAYPANQVLRVYVDTTPTPVSGSPGSTTGLAYPATVTNVSAGWDDVTGGDQLSLAIGDRTVDVAAITPAPPAAETVRPDMMAAVADISDDTVTLTYNESVVCDSTAAGIAAQYAYTDSTTSTAVAPSAVQCSGTATVVLTFADGVIATGDTSVTVVYTDESASADANDVRDLRGNQAQSPETQFGSIQA